MTAAHVSRLAADWLRSPDPPRWRELEGSAVLADLTGFTRLTEALAARGDEGAEVLHRSLTLCFSSLLDAAVEAGGDVIGFAGDAALVWFDGEGHERRAVEAAAAMPTRLARLPAAVTGGRRLRVSVGVHGGRVTALLAGRRQRAVFLCGVDMSTLVGLEAAAGPGQVAMSRSIAAHVPAAWCGDPCGDGVLVRRRERPGAGPLGSPVGGTGGLVPDDEATASLLAPAVRRLVAGAEGTGEHRAASIGFVSVPGLDAVLSDGGPEAAWRVLDHVATLVADVAAEHGVSWLDVDAGAGSVKLLLAAGVPDAVDADETRLLTALRRILDESEVPLRAGAQRGRVFAGALGVRSRRTYTVLGDAANVAARALGLAGDRQLVAGDGLRPGERADLRAEALGPVALKNRDRPMPLWRIDCVDRVDRAPELRPGGATEVPGRDAERQRLAERWKEARAGHGGACLVVGEPGMGGGELLRAVADLAGGAATLVAAHAQRRDVPYAAVAAVVAALAAGAGDEGDAWAWLVDRAGPLDGAVDGWLGQAEAALRGRSPGDGIDAVATAQRTRAALVALLSAAAPEPWLLAVDGIDEVDDASRLVLADLCGTVADRPWLVLAGARPWAEGEAGSPLEPVAAEVVALEPLDDDAARRLVLALDPRRRDDEVARLVTAARGNPFVLSELVRHPDGGVLPDSLERLATARIDALAPAVRRLVRDASAFGPVFAAELAARVLARPELTGADAWRSASEVVRHDGAATVTFRHEAYRLAAYRGLAFQRRRELHGAIADALATVRQAPGASEPGAGDAVLAFHLEAAGRLREAFPLAVAAARAARAAGAVVEAAELYGRSARLARTVERALLPELLVEQGEALMLVLDLAGADRAFAAAARVTSDPLAFASLCVQRAALESRRARFARARHWVRQGVTVLGPLSGTEADEVRVRLLLEDAGALVDQGAAAQSLPLATEALRVATAVGSPLLEALAHLHLELVLSAQDRPGAVDHGEAAVARFEAIGHERLLSVSLLNVGVAAMLEGRWDDALDRYERGAAAARRCGDARGVAIASVNTGYLLLRRGDATAADRCALEALRVFEAGGVDGPAAYARHLRSGVAALDGRPEDADALMAEARATFARLGDDVMVLDADVTRAGHLLRAGRAADALALADRVAADVARAGDELRVFHGLHRGLALARTGEADGGAATVADALERAGDRRRYERWACLRALESIAAAGGPPAPPGAADEADRLAAELGIVAPPL